MHLKLPELGEGVHEGELIKWLVKAGDTVKDDQPVCEIMTDKATVELPSPFHGKITEILAKEGSVVHVGQDILAYEGAGAAAGASAAPAKSPAPQAPVAQAAAPQSSGGSKSQSTGVTTGLEATRSTTADAIVAGGPVAAAPSTRKFARESGVDLSRVPASGPAGRIMREDVERFISGGGSGATSGGQPSFKAPLSRTSIAPGAQGSEERVPFKGLRKKIAEKMRQSKDHAAHFTYVEECDATELVKLRAQAKAIGETQGIKVTYLPFIMKAMAAAIRKYPIINSSLDEEKQELVYKRSINISLSVQTDDGLVAPVIKDVPGKSILQLAQEISEVVERARHRKLTMEDNQGGTVTLTNAGSIGGLFTTPVINYPEVAILGFNKISRKPVVAKVGGEEKVVIKDWTYFGLTCDHRVIDGAIAAEFTREVIRYVENPALLVLEG